jgi:hypothetical protein
MTTTNISEVESPLADQPMKLRGQKLLFLSMYGGMGCSGGMGAMTTEQNREENRFCINLLTFE